jgi:hypothetical protein
MKKIKFKKKTPAWKTIFCSFFSRELYLEVAERWSGTGFGFLFLLLVVLSVPQAIWLQSVASRVLPGVLDEIPDFQIEGGQFSSPVSQPYRVDFSPAAALVIDTTGKINQLDQIPGVENLQTVVLATKTQFQERRVSLGLSRDQVRDWASFPGMVVTREKMRSWEDFLVRWSGSLGYFCLVVFWFLFEVAALLVYALGGLLFSKMLKKRLEYDQSLRLSVVSHTPALIIVTLFLIVRMTEMPFWGAILISIVFLFWAVFCQKKRLPVTKTRKAF